MPSYPTIAFHLGAHFTHSDTLVHSLKKNGKKLKKRGVVVPPPKTYRPLIRDVLQRLAGRPGSVDTQDILLELILGSQRIDRLVLSNELFLSNHPNSFRNGELFPNAGQNTRLLRSLFPDCSVEFYISVRNPVAFLDSYQNSVKRCPLPDLLSELGRKDSLWYRPIDDIRTNNPDCHLHFWRYEDSPSIWPMVLGSVSGLGSDFQFYGELDMVKVIHGEETADQIRESLKRHPPETARQRRRVVASYLDNCPRMGECESPVIAGLVNKELETKLKEGYLEDVEDAAKMSGVSFLRP